MKKFFEGNPAEYFKEMSDKQLKDYPELAALKGCKQSPVHHPEGDAWVHTMQVVDAAWQVHEQAENPEGFLLSALLHDVGKPATTTEDPEKGIRSIGHEAAGVEPAINFMKRNGFDDPELMDYVEAMIKSHMQPRQLYEQQVKQKTYNKMFNRVPSPQDLILLSLCDNTNNQDLTSQMAVALQEALAAYEAS